MRYFKAIIAYTTVSPKDNITKKELTLFIGDNMFPSSDALRKIFIQLHHDGHFLQSWWQEVKLADIPLSELIFTGNLQHPKNLSNSGRGWEPIQRVA